MEASEGNWPRVEILARKLIESQAPHRTARAFLGLAAFKAGRYQEAEEHFMEASGQSDRRADEHAGAGLDLPGAEQDPGGARAPRRAEAAGLGAVLPALPSRADRPTSPAAPRRRAPPTSASPRTTSGRCASRSPSPAMPAMPAIQSWRRAFSTLIWSGPKEKGIPPRGPCRHKIEAGQRPELLIRTPAEGLAEAFFGLGEALSGEGSIGCRRRPPAVCALSRHRSATFPLVTLASAQETTKRYAAAIAAYDRIPKGTPLEINIDIRKALNLNQLERVGRGKEAAGRIGAPISQRHPSARGARQHHARAEAVR